MHMIQAALRAVHVRSSHNAGSVSQNPALWLAAEFNAWFASAFAAVPTKYHDERTAQWEWFTAMSNATAWLHGQVPALLAHPWMALPPLAAMSGRYTLTPNSGDRSPGAAVQL